MSTDGTFVYKDQRYRLSKIEGNFVFASKVDETGKASRGRPSKLALEDVKSLLPGQGVAVPAEKPVEMVNSFPDDTAPVNVIPETLAPPVTDYPVTDDGYVTVLD